MSFRPSNQFISPGVARNFDHWVTLHFSDRVYSVNKAGSIKKNLTKAGKEFKPDA